MSSKQPIQLLSINFSKPWWHIITQQRGLILSLVVSTLIRDVFWTFEPILVTAVLEQHTWSMFLVACFIWGSSHLNYIFMPHISIKLRLQIIHSIFHNAHKTLLNVESNSQLTKAQGTMFSKIERTARGYEEMVDQVIYSFAPLATSIVTLFVILMSYSVLLACIVFGMLLFMIGYGYYLAKYSCAKWENNFIRTDDEFKEIASESISQMSLIRNTFSTATIQQKLSDSILVNSNMERDLWLSYSMMSKFLSMMYVFSVLTLVGFFMYGLQNGAVSLAFAIGVVLAYIQCTAQVIEIIAPFRRYIRAVATIKDFFEYMGKIKHDEIKETSNDFAMQESLNTVIQIKDLVFGYGGLNIFENHSFDLDVPLFQKNKLYGIVGPSGVGKSTFISIIGGQLRPIGGTVMINGMNIYLASDSLRRKLVAIQSQVATNLKGTVRYNLLFGLPADHGYSDQFLYEILARVGLTDLFDKHEKLDTILSDATLNLSGGQKQRLNFASLYVRALFYKPAVILIDEPTSSLDAQSEIAIANMIAELAQMSVTLVIAHSLKTLKRRVGTIDFSSLKNKSLSVMPHRIKQKTMEH